MTTTFDLDAYAARVGLDRMPAPNEDGLRALHDAQFFSIPFENFDIQLGRGIDLRPEALFAKLVGQRRGGYCFELNGLMLRALHALGFRARPLLARVHLESMPSGRTHQLSLVEMGGRSWILDVGFGAGGLRTPLPLEDGYTERGEFWAYRLVESGEWGTMMQTLTQDEWRDSYSFDLSTVLPADIGVGNHYTSTAPSCHFVTSRVASLPLPRGRISLRNFTVTEMEDGESRTSEVEAGVAYLSLLADEFGIVLDARYDDLRPCED